MLELVGILLGIVVVFGFSLYAGGAIISHGMNRALTRQHQQLEWILGVGTAPPAWHRRYRWVLNTARNAGAPEGVLRGLERRYKRRLERRLFGLIKYFHRANVFPDDESRDELIQRLRGIGKTWEEQDWHSVVGLDRDV